MANGYKMIIITVGPGASMCNLCTNMGKGVLRIVLGACMHVLRGLWGLI